VALISGLAYSRLFQVRTAENASATKNDPWGQTKVLKGHRALNLFTGDVVAGAISRRGSSRY
jgi:hypothetical protein